MPYVEMKSINNARNVVCIYDYSDLNNQYIKLYNTKLFLLLLQRFETETNETRSTLIFRISIDMIQ
jgi:hypothetical protein